MKTRKEIKAVGLERFKGNYWMCVLASLLVSIVLGIIAGISSYGRTPIDPAYFENIEELSNSAIQMEATAPGPLNILGSILLILLAGPLAIGLASFFIRNIKEAKEQLSVTTPFSEAFKQFGTKLATYILKTIFIFLWSLLLVIPGIIKSFSYAMTDYLVAENPNISPMNAIKLSKKMMNGHKFEYFVFYLSFIGWFLLSIIPLVGVLFVNPYVNSSCANYYLELKEKCLRDGIITLAELDGKDVAK